MDETEETTKIEPPCKVYGNCNNFTTEEKCNPDCDFYAPSGEIEEIPELPEVPAVRMIVSRLPSFDKRHEFVVIKKHVFIMQSVSPKKIILKFKRKLKDTDSLPDGCYIFKDPKEELLEPLKVFTKFDKDAKEAHEADQEKGENE
jgi:hypothetical protein